MSKTLTFTHPHDLNKLHDELLAAVPALRPVNDQAVMLIFGDGEHLTLIVPDGANETAIGAVVAAHDPTPLPTPPSDAELIGEMIGSIEFGGDEASAELAAVMAALTAVLQSRGF